MAVSLWQSLACSRMADSSTEGSSLPSPAAPHTHADVDARLKRRRGKEATAGHVWNTCRMCAPIQPFSGPSSSSAVRRRQVLCQPLLQCSYCQPQWPLLQSENSRSLSASASRESARPVSRIDHDFCATKRPERELPPSYASALSEMNSRGVEPQPGSPPSALRYVYVFLPLPALVVDQIWPSRIPARSSAHSAGGGTTPWVRSQQQRSGSSCCCFGAPPDARRRAAAATTLRAKAVVG
jgi:hypothetical protein